MQPASSNTTSASAPSTASAPPVPTVRRVVERPPPGLAQGRYAAPAWLIGVFAVAIAAAALGFLWMRHRRHNARRGHDSIAPPSSRPNSSRR
jgi:hypothetical protein